MVLEASMGYERVYRYRFRQVRPICIQQDDRQERRKAMSITFFIQWYQWVQDGTWNWSEFDVVNISFERDKVAGDWNATVALLGFGLIFTYMTKAGAEKWEKIMREKNE